MSLPQDPNSEPASSQENDDEDDGEETYRLSKESPIAADGIVPPPPVFSSPVFNDPAGSSPAPTKKTPKTSRTPKPQRPRRQVATLSLSLVACCLLIFITSVCVMTLELTASRLIAKHVGSSLYTWTSVIGVVLAGITLGNWLGGWLADHYDRGRMLSWMYLFGSVSCGAVLWLDQLAGTLERPDSLSWQQWILAMVSAIFFVPALTMGTTSPLIASIALNRSGQTGTTVGNVYAWGAFGSIAGTFLTGFYLIDSWGTRSIVGMTAATLGILSILVASSRTLFRAVVLFGWLNLLGWVVLAAIANGDAFAAAGGLAAGLTSFAQSEQSAAAFRESCESFGRGVGERFRSLGTFLKLRDDSSVEFQDESNYSSIVIGDSQPDGKPLKTLRLDKLIHSYYDPEKPTALHYEYEQIYAAVTKKVSWQTSNRAPTACFYGGGGFIFPRWFLKEYPQSRRIDVAELDPAVLEVAKKQLGLNAELTRHIQTTIGDARNFVDDRLRENFRRRQDGEPPITYDFIYGDAFNDFSVPFHLTTFEFLQKTLELLSANGVYQANIIDIYPRTEYLIEPQGIGFVEYTGPLPFGLLNKDLRENRSIRAVPYYAPLEIAQMTSVKYQLRVGRAIKPFEEKRLKSASWTQRSARADAQFPLMVASPAEKAAWNKAIENLSVQSNRKRTLARPLPSALKISSGDFNRWVQASDPFEFVEVYRTDRDNYVLGLRGVVSIEDERRLLHLAPDDGEWGTAISTAAAKSRANVSGRFLGRLVATASQVFPNVYVFNTSEGQPNTNRDTFVMVCSRQPLTIGFLDDTEDWYGGPFASFESRPGTSDPKITGHMSAILALSGGKILTDDFAPVDNLLAPVVSDQE